MVPFSKEFIELFNFLYAGLCPSTKRKLKTPNHQIHLIEGFGEGGCLESSEMEIGSWRDCH